MSSISYYLRQPRFRKNLIICQILENTLYCIRQVIEPWYYTHLSLFIFKCGEEHDDRECVKEYEAPPKCSPCGGGHAAKYRGYPEYKKVSKIRIGWYRLANAKSSYHLTAETVITSIKRQVNTRQLTTKYNNRDTTSCRKVEEGQANITLVHVSSQASSDDDLATRLWSPSTVWEAWFKGIQMYGPKCQAKLGYC